MNGINLVVPGLNFEFPSHPQASGHLLLTISNGLMLLLKRQVPTRPRCSHEATA